MYAVLADIHGNLHAMERVLDDIGNYDIDGFILLGDIIDYGMRSNEVTALVRDRFDGKAICNIWGNHERAIMTDDYAGFSTQRGVDCARHTAGQLSTDTRDYLNTHMTHEGMSEFEIGSRRCLAVHGSLQDPYWQSITPEDVRGNYGGYDVVFSGHSHHSHVFTRFYEVDDPAMRNKHAVTFINPGSVGQPRNLNPCAQYALLDIRTMSVNMRAVPYDVRSAMNEYDGSVDAFYRDRLFRGI